jgi:hypothetical protein
MGLSGVYKYPVDPAERGWGGGGDTRWSPLTAFSRILLKKLTGLQPVTTFPAFYGTRNFIIAFTNVRHLSLS